MEATQVELVWDEGVGMGGGLKSSQIVIILRTGVQQRSEPSGDSVVSMSMAITLRDDKIGKITKQSDFMAIYNACKQKMGIMVWLTNSENNNNMYVSTQPPQGQGQGGGKPKKGKVYTGPKGGKYMMKGGKKVYM